MSNRSKEYAANSESKKKGKFFGGAETHRAEVRALCSCSFTRILETSCILPATALWRNGKLKEIQRRYVNLVASIGDISVHKQGLVEHLDDPSTSAKDLVPCEFAFREEHLLI
jgi:hypothetical protein